ncbi:SGNH/GDSL hydrolase family protein [Amycolatopsis minnesotensis]|uniref:SGNH/GDSL hydrolase family protein n=1 Tax=Amycolatopsis minnesotensis TaxID=337894 RepID=A0ABP5BKV9_9PSEU
MKRTTKRRLSVLAAVALVSAPVAPASAAAGFGWWRGVWASAPQAPDPGNWSGTGFAGQTVRQVVRVSAGGAAVRIRLSNTYGRTPLPVAGATLGRSGGGAAADSVRPLTFGYRPATVIPPGGEIVSDPAFFPVAPLDKLAVTLSFTAPTGPVTYHALGGDLAYRAQGDHAADTSADAFTETSRAGYLVTGADTLGPPLTRTAVVAFGDSITDGFASTFGAGNSYPDELVERLHGRFGVLNEGIGSNFLLADYPGGGEAGITRFARDVVARPGVRSVIVLEGINDIGASDDTLTVERLIEGQRTLIAMAHAKGIKAIGGTVIPFEGSPRYTEHREALRAGLNAWIRNSGEYDAVADFDHAVADPADPHRIRPGYDSGDHIHPGDTGYHAMASVVDPATL